MPSKTTSFLQFDSPAQLLAFYDPHILEGKITLYPWQAKVHRQIALDLQPGQASNIVGVVAANGSGKSKNIVAPAALYNGCQYDKSETVLTTASGSQLDRQSARYVKDYARKMNAKHNQELWSIQHRKLVFQPTDGIVDLFATDEPGQAEGWHQRDFDTSFMIIVDECKTVSDDIFSSLDRCHDAQRKILVSSPGHTSGYFFKIISSGKGIKVFKISAFDCPHISQDRIQMIIQTYGRHSPITRSIIDAEFSSVDEQIVISYDQILQLIAEPALPIKDTTLRVGGDLAAGGDENVISIFKGNKQIAMQCFREKDTTQTVDKVIFILSHYSVAKDSEHLYFDDGGVGKAMIDSLRKKGWNIKRVLNQSKPRNTERYSNRGAELWFNFASLVINHEIVLWNDETLHSQLSNRFYNQNGPQGKILLEDKRKAKLKGHPSPDRADATVLAMTGVKAPYFTLLGNEQAEESFEDKIRKHSLTQDELIALMDQEKYSVFKGQEQWNGGDSNRRVKVQPNANLSMLAMIDHHFDVEDNLLKELIRN